MANHFRIGSIDCLIASVIQAFRGFSFCIRVTVRKAGNGKKSVMGKYYITKIFEKEHNS